MDVELVRIGDGGAGGEVEDKSSLGGPVASPGVLSPEPAWANNRDREDGPATGVEFIRGGDGNNRDVGGRVTVNVSSTSASGSPGGASLTELAAEGESSGVSLLFKNLRFG